MREGEKGKRIKMGYESECVGTGEEQGKNARRIGSLFQVQRCYKDMATNMARAPACKDSVRLPPEEPRDRYKKHASLMARGTGRKAQSESVQG